MLKVKTIIWIWCLLLGSHTNGNCSELQPDLIVKKNSAAPYDGVLLDENSYRFYQNEISALEVYEKRMNEAPAKGDTTDMFVRGLVIGITSGILGTLAIDHVIKGF